MDLQEDKELFQKTTVAAIDMSSAEEEEIESRTQQGKKHARGGKRSAGARGGGRPKQVKKTQKTRKLRERKPIPKTKLKDAQFPEPAIVKLESMPFVVPMAQLTKDFPHMSTDSASSARCVGLPASAVQENKQSASSGTSSAVASSSSSALPPSDKDEKQVAIETMKRNGEMPVQLPMEHTELQKRLDACGRTQLCEEMNAVQKVDESASPIESCRNGQAALFESLADHESFLLRASGKWQVEDDGPVFDFPPCRNQDKCRLRSKRILNKCTGISYMYPSELTRFLNGTAQILPERPCVACIRFQDQDFVYAYRSLLMRVNSRQVAHESKQVIAHLQKIDTSSEGREDELKLPSPMSPAFELSKNRIIQMYANRKDGPGGYRSECMIVPVRWRWEGLVAPIAAWNLDWIVEKKTKFGQPVFDQTFMVWSSKKPAFIEPGSSQEDFYCGVVST